MTNIELQTLNAVKIAAKKYANPTIDWEQRRYEISKDILAGRLSNANNCVTDAVLFVESCVDYADLLIECLKK